jgi:tight adherence protein C
MFSLIIFLVLVTIVNVVVFFVSSWNERDDKGSEFWRDRPPSWFTLFLPVINMFKLVKPLSPDSMVYQMLADKLKSSGYSYAIKPEEFSASRWVGLAFGCTFVFVIVYGLAIENINHIVMALFAIPIGFFYPDIWLNDAVKERQKKISKHFPFFLELLVLSMRAGLNFTSALEHATNKLPDGPLRQELQHLVRDIRTGLSRRESLDLMAKRVAMPEVSNFVAAINQAEEVGGELGDLLFKQATQRRKERFLKAEEMAGKAPVKMLGPLILLLFPMTFVVIIFVLYIKARDGGALNFLLGT